DVSMRAEILSYSRAHGVFAGISLEGSTIRPDNDATADVYGRKLTAREIVIDGHTGVPASGRHLVAVLERHSPRMEAKAVGSR
ncbi:MAG TPA: YSC84-related protein, partial [Candidatus Acidoferrales bacterium]|nr:YSC84-related protein [Candidatus Acidoferrales bacterium]